MVQTRLFDAEMTRLHRQGRVSIYSSSEGEEAIAVAAAMTLSDADWLFPDYRVTGALFERGVPMEEPSHNSSGCPKTSVRDGRYPPTTAPGNRHIASISSPVGNVRAVQPRRRFRFASEPLDELGIGIDALRDDFDRDIPVQNGVVSLVDLAHRAFSEFPTRWYFPIFFGRFAIGSLV